MTELQIYHDLLLVLLVAAGVSFVALFFVTAPYGRHLRPGWGPAIPARIGWLIMESPAVIVFAYVYWLGDQRLDIVPLIFLAMWQFHYVYRSFIYPFRLPASGTAMPISIIGMALVFNAVNAYLNARWISGIGYYPDAWVSNPACIAGVVIFVTGWAINQHSDTVLLRLRKRNAGYSIPRGGLYRWVSCPNYLGEIVAWSGWAIASWSPAGLVFAVFTAANLVPRAIANHRWYGQTFNNYPAQRKALIPHVL